MPEGTGYDTVSGGLEIFDDPGMPDFGDTFEDFSDDMVNIPEQGMWGSIWDAITSPTARNLLNIGSGLYGLYESGQQRNLARDAIRGMDPFGPYRSQYAQQLMSLMSDPSKITEDPGYKFQFNQGQQAVERSMAARGFLGSGNEAIALTEYGQGFAANYLDRQRQFLAGLAGANISPNYGPGITGYGMGLDTASQALASLGYGITRGGAAAGTPAAGPKAAGGEAAMVGAGLSGVGRIVGGTTGRGLSSAGGVISGLAQGGVEGYSQAVASGTKLAGTAGIGGTTAANVGSAIGSLGSIYGGVEQGGVAGYASAAKGLYDLAGGSAGTASTGTSALASGSALSGALGIYTGWKSLTETEGKLGGTISGAQAGYQIGGPWGALIGAGIGYTVEGGYKDAAPYDAAGFTGTTMDQAWADQNVLRLASNPAASIANKWLGVSSKSTLGKILDPAAAFERHGDEKRNFRAFSKAFPGIQDIGHGMWKLPDGKEVTGDQIQWLAGTWYGATYAPDGDQAGWQAKFEQAMKDIYEPSAESTMAAISAPSTTPRFRIPGRIERGLIGA